MSQRKPTLTFLISVGIFISSSLFGAVERSALKIDGQVRTGFGPSACTKTATVDIELPPKLLLEGHLQFWAMFVEISKKKQTDPNAKPETFCDASVSDSNKLKESFSQGNATLDVRKFMPDAACGKEGASGERALCIYVDQGKELVSYARFSFSTTYAKVDDIVDKSGANGEVSFTVKVSGQSAAGGALEFITCYGKTAEGNINEKDCPNNFLLNSSPKSEVVITELENDVDYSFKVKIVSGIEESPWSKPFNIKPERVAPPLTAYNGKGSDIQWSCRQSGLSSVFLLLFSLLGLLLLRFRHYFLFVHRPHIVFSKRFKNLSTRRVNLSTRSVHHLFVFSLFFFLSVVFSKTGYTEPGQVNVGLLGAMYRPDLDSEVTASGNKIFPFYKCFFRKDKKQQDGPINPLLGFEVDVHLWDRFGSLQLGLGLGYTFTRGHDLKYNVAGEPDCDNPSESSKISLHMYQLRPQLTYMFNPFADVFPLIPYFRAGLIGHGYMFFRGSKGEKTNTTADGTVVKSNGIRLGYDFAIGLMVMLDFLERSSIRAARGQGFLEHIYLKGELSYTKIDTFGRRGFQFSAKDVMGTSLPLMWTFGLVFELP